MRKILSSNFWKYAFAFLVPMVFTVSIVHWLDNDSWYILAEGRYISENGVFYTDPLSMHEGLNVVVQNYGFAVLFYWIFSIFGAAGIYIIMLALLFLICFLLYKIFMLLSNKNVNLSLLLMMVNTTILSLACFVVTRAQMVSFVIFLALIYVLELYVKTSKIKYLFWVPLLSFIQINLHASLWLMLILALIVYIIDSIKAPRLHLQGYKTKPLIIVGVLSSLVGLVNPYGVKMMTFILSSYLNGTFKEIVGELGSFSPLNGLFGIIIYSSIVISIVLLVFGKRGGVRVRHLMMYFGFLALGLNTIKGMSQFILVMFLPLATVYKGARFGKLLDDKFGRDVLVFWGGVIASLIFSVLLITVCMGIEDNPGDGLVEAVDAIEVDSGERERGSTVYAVFTGYNDGGYLEYRGFKPYLDPRGEYFLKKINGKEDILKEWSDFRKGRISTDELLKKYDFDYLFVRGENDPFYGLDNEEYELFYTDKENEIELYRKVLDE